MPDRIQATAIVTGAAVVDLVVAALVGRAASTPDGKVVLTILTAVTVGMAIVMIMKGRVGSLIGGLMLAPFWGIGVLLLLAGTFGIAYPNSWWARHFYTRGEDAVFAQEVHEAVRDTDLDQGMRASGRSQIHYDPARGSRPGQLPRMPNPNASACAHLDERPAT